MSNAKEILTVDEVAKRLRVSRYTVVRLIENGDIKGRKIGSQWRVWAEDFKEYMGRVATDGTV